MSRLEMDTQVANLSVRAPEGTMDGSTGRRLRLQTLLDLARVARGWSRAQLARALDRDPTKVLPESANPKLDYLVKLGEVLEWPVGEVADVIWNGGAAGARGPAPTATFEEYNDLIAQSLRSGEFQRSIELSQQMFRVARTGDERAHACIREAAGWDGMGRYPKVLDAVRRGLQQGPLSVRIRLVLQATLANAQYTLWDLTPALGTTEVLARWYDNNPPTRPHDWKRVAYVHYVRGNVRRRLMIQEPESRKEHAESGRRDLLKAAEMYEGLAKELGDDSLSGVANTCRGGIIEIDVELGRLPAVEGIAELRSGLERAGDLNSSLTGDWIESYGWWSIFGSDLALRHLQGRDLQQAMGVFLTRALDIAERLDNWAMRERVFTLQFALHTLMVDSTGLDLAFTIDEQQRSLITATMGRLPSFQSTAWKILETARVVRPKTESVA